MTGMKLDLSGTWEFRLDAEKKGIQQKYYAQALEDVIILPATTAEAHKGICGETNGTDCLTEPYHFEGYAWYARTLEIPKERIGNLAQLVIERTRVSYVWVDDRFVGTQDSFAAAHRYDLTKYLTSVSHKLTVMVSNVDYKTKGGHMTSPDTQTNWNGMLGQIALILEPVVRVENLRVDAEAKARSVKVRFTTVCGEAGIPEKCGSDRQNRRASVCCTVRKAPGTGEPLLKAYREITLTPETKEYGWSMDVPEGRKIALWNEYTPNLYEVTVEIIALQDGTLPEHGTAGSPSENGAERNLLGCAKTVIGFRDLHTGKDFPASPVCEANPAIRQNSIFYLNDLPVMLRGKHDGMIFPMTGYAPMDQDSWEKVFHIAREYGMNHYRFHTCCPPEAAFAAADKLGIYLAPELPFWGTVAGEEETPQDRAGRAWLLEEGFRILREFGNHPSFVILSLGNELWGSRQVLNDILGQYKAEDGRHLYVQGSNNFQFRPVILENDDFFSGVRFARERLFRGSYAMCDAPQGHIQTRMPDNCHNYDEAIRPRQISENAAAEPGEVEIQFGTGTKTVKADDSGETIPQVPVVSHEIGQYEFYPDYGEIAKYTGVLQPENLRIFRNHLETKGLLHMAQRFFRAAGHLAVECYKRELETAFRSRELAGFQILDLQDFTGQGTALVGILNAFMENKGLISAEEWREFCNDRVAMLSFPTYVYETGGSFDYEALLCNMRPNIGGGDGTDEEGDRTEWEDVRLTVELSNRTDGQILAQAVHDGALELARLKSFGRGSLPIPAGDAPMLLRAAVSVYGSGRILAKNHYDLYAYPAAGKHQQHGPAPVTVTGDKEKMLAGLRAGERVFFFGSSIREAYSIEGTYCTDFWCYPMFASISESMGKPLPVGTMGLYMDKAHPVFAQFPTEGYTAPQWWRIVTGSRVAVLDGLPVEPLVWMIDHFSRNHKLGLVYEAKVNGGSLLVCQADLLSQDSPEVNRFYDSLLAYAASEKFRPQAQIEEAWLEKVY